MSDFSFISNAHPAVIESLYKQYQQDPQQVDSSWHNFFKGFDFAYHNANGNGAAAATTNGTVVDVSNMQKEFAVMAIIHGYRDRGHLLSKTNPIRPRLNREPHLDLTDYRLDESDLDKTFISGEEIGLKNATLRQIILQLQKIYTEHIGIEFAHIENRERRMWLRNTFEKRNLDSYEFSMDKKRRILEKLNGAVGMEEFLAKKYGATKRFGLEGGESTIPGIDTIINKSADLGAEEVVIGMAHRGRLNVLANILGKTYDNIFNEFEGGAMPDLTYGSGDVKYHMGYSSQIKALNGKDVYLKLLPNPSHLEAIDPVMEGFAKAKLDMLYANDYKKICPIMIHGDASVAGQGIVYEVLQMSKLPSYFVGGTIHFVINNQIGFTTDFHDARSSTYCSSIASTIQAPVFHVNGDDPEAVVYVCELASEYRNKFGTDVFIDMVCYRKNGHNESDNPEVTQPLFYKLIKNHKNPREIYIETLVNRDKLDATMAQEMAKSFDDNLQARLANVKQKPLPYVHQEPELAWKSLRRKSEQSDFDQSPITGVDESKFNTVLAALKKVPEGFKLTSVIERLMKNNDKNWADDKYDWASGELLAYGSILTDGKDVRLSGEDVKRGTFSHRHAVFFNAETNGQYNRLAHITDKQGRFHIYNSLLSEYGVLGFEYGYSLASPDNLVLWEAQFGDFHNGAQTTIDQFICAGESKWQRQSGLVMLLPHGYEGQGPEHSSARLERFLQLCAENNMYVTNISTPANLFHALRRQLAQPFRKPLINMSPKSLLRHPLCVSKASDFLTGTKFQEVIDDTNVNAKDVKKLLFCTGKVYYDLLKYQSEQNIKDTAIVRVEQLYPFPTKQVNELLEKYSKSKKIAWVQEEPQNMGAWMYLRTFVPALADATCISRAWAASPATGYLKVHEMEQKAIVEKAFSF